MPHSSKQKRLSRMQKILLGVLIAFLFYTVIGFLVLPSIVKSILADKLSSALHRDARVLGVKINPYTFTVRLEGVSVEDTDGKPFVSLDALFFDVQLSSVVKRALVLKTFDINKPYFRIVRNEKGGFNFDDLVNKEKKETETSKLIRFFINTIKISNGTIDFFDLSHKPSFTTNLNSFEFTMDHFTSQPDKHSTFKLSVKTGKGEKIDSEGRFSLNPLSTEGVITLNGTMLKNYETYYRDYIKFNVSEGSIGFKTRYRYHSTTSGPAINLFQASLSLSALKLEDPANREAFFILPKLSVENTKMDVTARTLTVGHLSSEDGLLICRRSAEGVLNLESMVVLPSKPTASKPQTEEPELLKPWQADLKSLLLKNYTVKFNDRMPPEPVDIVLDQVSLNAENLSTKKTAKGNTAVTARLNKKGKLAFHGPISIQPLSADLEVLVNGVDIRAVQPYFTEIVRLVVTDGNFNATGRLNFSFLEESKPTLHYQGNTFINAFASKGKQKGNDFVKWESLYLSGMDVHSHPLRINIDNVALTGHYTQLIINPDGSVNVNTVIPWDKFEDKPEPGRSEDVTKELKTSPLPEINIHTVTLQNGAIHFVDRLTRPNFETDLLELGGRISNLSSDNRSRADVYLKGVSGTSSPLEITGKINPLSESLFADMRMVFKDIQLSPFSPYSGKYIGYIIQKGSLTLELDYKLIEQKLQGSNRIFLDQLTLGDKVDSPDATSLPVRLAISLLKDRNGRIELDFPVEGNLNNPEFNISKLVLTVFTNLVSKIATSPFSALASVFGGGEELSFIEFEYGSIEINDASKEKLDTLITALYERPSLQLDIVGSADPEKDRDTLRYRRLNHLLKTEKRKNMVEKGIESVSIDQIVVTPEEKDVYIKQAYESADFTKPRNSQGQIKELSPAEMEKLLITNIQIADDDLRLLAHKRAFGVQDYILKSEKVEPKRIFILEPKSLLSEDDTNAMKSRVNFTLK
ncbi:DUF748 domain-containing protein [Thermodesulfobacteriota bacterium]